MTNKILITGSDGLVASRFIGLNKEFELVTSEIDDMDITKPNEVETYIKKQSPDLIINFAAFTNVAEAENQTGDKNQTCWQINVEGVKNLIQSKGLADFIQISTDMVFAGNETNPGPYAEDMLPPENNSELTWYGWTKNRAEKSVIEADQTIVRIIYPVKVNKHQKLDYIHRPLGLFLQNKLYPLFDDQQTSFTFIDDLCRLLNKIIKTKAKGIFHCSTDLFSPYELISYAVDKMNKDFSTIQKTSIFEFLKNQTNPNRYPTKGGLLCQKTQDRFGLRFLNWRQTIDKLIADGLETSLN